MHPSTGVSAAKLRAMLSSRLKVCDSDPPCHTVPRLTDATRRRYSYGSNSLDEEGAPLGEPAARRLR